MRHKPTERGLEMLISLHTTGQIDSHLFNLPPWEAKQRATGLRQIRQTLILHNLIVYVDRKGLELTPEGRLYATKALRVRRKEGATGPSDAPLHP